MAALRGISESMPRKPKPKSKPNWDDAEQSQRFLETANAVEASDDPKEFERALKKIAPFRPKPKSSR